MPVNNRIMGLLGNPLVQGVAGAAAFGANPLLGLLAGPGIKADRERRQSENELRREQLLQAKRKRELSARTRELIGGILGDDSVAPQVSAGFMGPPQAGREIPVSDDFVGPPEVEGGKVGGLLGETPAESKQQNVSDLIKSLNTAPNFTNIPNHGGIRLSNNQKAMLQFMAEVDPEAALQATAQLMGLGGRQETSTSMVRNLQAAGINPRSEKGRQIIMDNLSNAPGDQLNQLSAEVRLFELENLREAREQQRENKSQARASLQTETVRTMSKARELAQLNDQLEGTFLETGLPIPDFRRITTSGGSAILGSLGFDTKRQRELVGRFDRFNKLSTDFGIGLVERLRGTGAISNQKFDALLQTMAGIGTSPDANRLIIADLIETGLEGARINNITLSDADSLQKLSEKLRSRKADLSLSPESGQGEPRNFRWDPETSTLVPIP